MANIFTSRPYIIDTAWDSSTIPAELTDNGSAQTFHRIIWLNPATAGDQVIITDVNDNIILTATCDVADKQQILWDAGNAGMPMLLPYGKWIVSTIDSGQLYLYK